MFSQVMTPRKRLWQKSQETGAPSPQGCAILYAPCPPTLGSHCTPSEDREALRQVAHSSHQTVLFLGTLAAEPIVLAFLQGALNSQPALLFAGQTDSENGPVPGGLEAGTRPGALAAQHRDGRKEYPVGNYLAPTCLFPCTNGRPARMRAKNAGELGTILSCRLLGEQSPGKRLLGEAG